MNKKTKNEELKRLDVESFVKAQKMPIIVVLDDIRSLNNIGSIFRTSDAFRVEKIYLCGITAKPPHRDIHKTALGATESVEWEYFEEIQQAIDQIDDDYAIISVEQTEKSIQLNDFHPTENRKYAVVLGNEVRGVSQKIVDISDYCIEIPQFGTKHSFNVSVCCGIVLWDLFNKNKFFSTL